MCKSNAHETLSPRALQREIDYLFAGMRSRSSCMKASEGGRATVLSGDGSLGLLAPNLRRPQNSGRPCLTNHAKLCFCFLSCFEGLHCHSFKNSWNAPAYSVNIFHCGTPMKVGLVLKPLSIEIQQTVLDINIGTAGSMYGRDSCNWICSHFCPFIIKRIGERRHLLCTNACK